MTVRQFADSRHITRQAVYKLAAKAGKKLSEFTDSKGNLSEEGLAFLESLVPEDFAYEADPADSAAPVNDQTNDQQNNKSSDQPANDAFIEHLLDEIEFLRKQIESKDERLREALSLNGHLQTMIKRLGDGSEPDVYFHSEGETVESEPEQEPKQDPDQDKDDHKPEDPAKREGESAAETPSPVASSDQVKTDQDKKASFGKRLRYLFTGKQ